MTRLTPPAAEKMLASGLASVDLSFTPLQAHLLREHGFLQGRGSEFRLEPRDLAALYRVCRS